MKLAALLILAASAPAQAGPYIVASTASTYDLQQSCSKSPHLLSLDFCGGYVLGVFDTLSFAGAICPPSGGATESAMGVAKSFIAQHPEKWSYHPALLLREAFQAAFPCPIGKRGEK